MIYSNFADKQLSLLGFGAMRLPLMPGGSTTDIDMAQTAEMIRMAFDAGVNYIDTAYPYHGGASETALGAILKDYPRESYYLANKYPGHQIADKYDPADIFEEQLKKCGVEYFDFYLLHNVCEKCIDVYLDPQWGIIDYFVEQKRLGRIKHLGFSTHAQMPCLKQFLELHGDKMEFCQIQLNYLDWTLQEAKEKCELLAQYKIPVWVMEPLRGGKLANLAEENAAKLKALRPDESIAAWAFRWLQGVDNVQMVLSGMSNIEQMADNLRTFEECKPLSPAEEAALMEIAEGLKNNVPCTACRYCCDGCPMGLDIPLLLGIYNELRFAPNMNANMRIEALPEDKRPGACIGCGACMQACPQNIDIPAALRDLHERFSSAPSWASICAERAAAAAAQRAANRR